MTGGLHFQNEKTFHGWCSSCSWRGSGREAWENAQHHTALTQHRTIVQTTRLTTIEPSKVQHYDP